MFHMNQNLKVVLAVEPVDLRKRFHGLYAAARSGLGEAPEDGALFPEFNNGTPKSQIHSLQIKNLKRKIRRVLNSGVTK